MEKESYTGFDAALDEEQQMKEGKYKKAEKYYDSIFEGIETESLPLPDCSGKTPERGYLSMPVDTRESLVLSACEKLGVTPNILFTGVFGILMSRYSNSEESLFATIYNGRNDSRLENTVCMLVKTLPVYCSCDPKVTIQAYMTELSEQILSSMANDIFRSLIFVQSTGLILIWYLHIRQSLGMISRSVILLPGAMTFLRICQRCLC